MPKPTKLHSKGKVPSNSKQKPCTSGPAQATETMDNEEAVRQFQLELCWCIQELERSLSNNKGNEKHLQDAWKVLQVLKNNNQPIIRKRQLMRSHFGDYRAKMLAEEKKLVKMTSKMKIVDKPANPKATFLRKSMFQSTGDSSFRFNFTLPPNEVDSVIMDNTVTTDISNSNEQSNNTPSVGNTSDTAVTDSGDNVTPKDNSKTFKLPLSGSEFRFNFNISNS